MGERERVKEREREWVRQPREQCFRHGYGFYPASDKNLAKVCVIIPTLSRPIKTTWKKQENFRNCFSGRGPHLIARVEKILDYQVDSGLVDDAPLLGVLAVECRRESRDDDELESLHDQKSRV